MKTCFVGIILPLCGQNRAKIQKKQEIYSVKKNKNKKTDIPANFLENSGWETEN